MNCRSVVVEFTIGIKDFFDNESHQLLLNSRDKILLWEIIPHVNTLSFKNNDVSIYEINKQLNKSIRNEILNGLCIRTLSSRVVYIWFDRQWANSHT
jgi:hypothetical protein